jgi:beta-lactamase regulating signal transducer with metallopeptidase domain/Tfp pilus assembly protein PilF
MNNLTEILNAGGEKFVEFSVSMLIQSSILIVILLAIDLLLRKKVRATFRYWLWMLILVKLVLPPTLTSPMSFGRIFGDKITTARLEPAVDSRLITTEVEVPAEAVITSPLDASGTQSNSAEWSRKPVEVPVTPALTNAVTPVEKDALNWRAIVLIVWVGAAVAMIMLVIQRLFFVLGLIRQAQPAQGIVTETLEFCRKRMGVNSPIRLKMSANATSPAVCGLIRPVILMPHDIGPSLGAEHLRPVLMHELGHVKRGDLWVNLAQTTLQIFYFYNPLIWLANAVIRRIREQAVDEMVQVAMGEKAQEYPETLLNVARLAFSRPALALRFIGVVESRSALNERIKKMLSRPIPKTAKLGFAGFIVIAIIAAVLLPMASAVPNPPELVIKGKVIDAQTDKPVAGAKVYDDTYGPGPDWKKIESGFYEPNLPQWGAITDENGQYAFLTWPEHHNFKIEADGYISQRKTLYSGHFTLNKKEVEVFDYALVPLNNKSASDNDDIQTYKVNKSVAEFDEAEDLSTPESAYAAINRLIASGGGGGWARLSVKRMAERFSGEEKKYPDPEWAQVLLNAQILDVYIFEDRLAMVTAKLPQEFTSKTIKNPIDVRNLELENGKWLNVGNDRVNTIKDAAAIFQKRIKAAETKNVSQNPAGNWQSVDFVEHIEDFKPGTRQFKGNLFLKGLEFHPDHTTSGPWAWKTGSLYHPGDKTTAKYEIKEIDGSEYLFMEWMSGDVTIRGQEPQYYVLKKIGSITKPIAPSNKSTELSNYNKKPSRTDKMEAENLSADGWKLWAERNLAEAEDKFTKAVEKDPANANAWNGLGWAQQNQGKTENAKYSFEKCLELEPRQPAALNGLGWIAKSNGQIDDAIKYWEKAVWASNGMATASLNGLTQTYMELEQYDQAIKCYEKWLKVEPSSEQAKEGLAKAQALQN